MLFLIEYDRSQGEVIAIQEFHDSERKKAENARLDLELRLNHLGIERKLSF